MIGVQFASTKETDSFHVYESEALIAGVEGVSVDGRDRLVEGGVRQWFLEADTKVDDDAPFFPVILHRWES